MQNDRLATASAADFKKIPGSPIAYWVSESMRNLFTHSKLDEVCETRLGMATANNDQFLRQWYEVSVCKFSIDIFSREDAKTSGFRWFPYQKGGDYRKWYGNLDFLVNWEWDGYEIRNFVNPETAKVRSHNYNLDYIFKEGVTWNALTSSKTSARISRNSLFDNAGSSLFASDISLHKVILAYINSNLIVDLISLISPTLNYQPGDIAKLPAFFELEHKRDLSTNTHTLINLASIDWDTYETSWDFTILLLLKSGHHQPTLKATYTTLRTHWRNMTLEMQCLEEKNNRIFIEAYGLQDELTPDVPLSEITLTCNPHYRYGGNKNEEELESLLLADTIKELISYAIGCMMGRYSLNHPGLIYAHSGNEGFDSSKYKIFPADDDGIIPIMDQNWFPDDTTNRFVEFLKVAWSPETLDENLKFVADSLKPKNNEAPVDTIRRYLSAGFFKDHLKTYKKRPIYWLFSSGKQKAFECLVYLHRYNESTLPRMRSNYVTPLQGKFNARLDYLRTEIDAADTASAKKKIQKEIDILKKKQAELSAFDIELRHYADLKIFLDLDDGVKVNYDKFGNLLAEKKAVTGTK